MFEYDCLAANEPVIVISAAEFLEQVTVMSNGMEGEKFVAF